MKILLVEDELKLAESLKKSLLINKCIVDVVSDGVSGFQMASKDNYDVIILDVFLPKMDGFTVCRNLRLQNISTPILLLTVLNDIKSKVKGLDSGADDYLVKPFSFRELMARIRSITRRTSTHKYKTTILDVGNLMLDIAKHRVERDGKEIQLTMTEFNLLKILMENSGIVLTREDIIKKIRKNDFKENGNTIDVYIRYLRSKIDDKFEDKLIKTIRGIGYKISE